MKKGRFNRFVVIFFIMVVFAFVLNFFYKPIKFNSPDGTGSGMCPDGDGDDYAVCDNVCTLPSGKSCGDCDDGDSNINPSGSEEDDTCFDGENNDCSEPITLHNNNNGADETFDTIDCMDSNCASETHIVGTDPASQYPEACCLVEQTEYDGDVYSTESLNTESDCGSCGNSCCSADTCVNQRNANYQCQGIHYEEGSVSCTALGCLSAGAQMTYNIWANGCRVGGGTLDIGTVLREPNGRDYNGFTWTRRY